MYVENIKYVMYVEKYQIRYVYRKIYQYVMYVETYQIISNTLCM